MTKPPRFFVPGVDAALRDAKFQALAVFAQRPLPDLRDRIFEIRFVHNLEEVWTATVGEPLYGTHLGIGREGGRNVAVPRPLADRAIVLAIFPGPDAYVVVTNHGDPVKINSGWPNPFSTQGRPKRVIRFSVE
jgi:hypothetical protein